MSPEYKAAYESHNKASSIYRQLSADHLAFKISDEEYFAGRKLYEAATKVYDEAFAKESNQ